MQAAHMFKFNYFSRLALPMLLLALCNHSEAYKEIVHQAITLAAVQNSVLGGSKLQIALRIKGIDDTSQLFAASSGSTEDDADVAVKANCVHGSLLTVHRLIGCGAMFEDAGLRALHHFYNYQQGGSGLAGFSSSPSWSIDGTGMGQEFAWKDARAYYFSALTNNSEIDRRAKFGLAFQTIGQVMHHVEDMAQPQHTRGDDHCDAESCRKFGPLLYKPSAYENYSATRDELAKISVWAASPAQLSYPSGLTPRDFWAASQSNMSPMASYTSTHYVSIGTNFAVNAAGQPTSLTQPWPRPALPIGTTESILAVFTESRRIPDQSIVDFCKVDAADCNVQLVDTTDGLKHVSSLSIFDGDLKLVPSNSISYSPLTLTIGPDGQPSYAQDGSSYSTAHIFSLNTLNYDAILPDLIGRASDHSRALIDYFFRGQLTLSTPKIGVFGLVDYGSIGTCDYTQCGFTQLRVGVQNTTPQEGAFGGKNANMVAVAYFYINNCFKGDESGNYGVSGQSAGCRATMRSSVASAPLAVQNGVSSVIPNELTFDFSQHPIPLAATDVFLQVVYQGTLGSELDNAVAVGETDLSEPTNFVIENNNDYKMTTVSCLQISWVANPRATTEVPPRIFTATFGASLQPAVAGTLVSGEHMRVAVLGLGSSTPVHYSANRIFSSGNLSSGGPFNFAVEEFDDAGKWQTSKYYAYRGERIVQNTDDSANRLLFTEDLNNNCGAPPSAFESAYPKFTNPIKAATVSLDGVTSPL